MSFSADKVTKDLARGAGIIFIGTFLMYIFKFIYRIIVSRYLGPEGYGLLSLGDVVMNFGYMIALIGLDVGLMRHLAYFKEKGDIARLKGSFWGTILISGTLSAILILLLITFSRHLSLYVFKNPELAPILIVFAIAIPLCIFARIIGQTLLAFKKQWYEFFSKVLGRDFINLILVSIIILIGGSVLQIAIMYLIALTISIITGYIFLERKVFPFAREKTKSIFEHKERISFAFPLFFSAVFINVMQWIDTFFIGYFRSTAEVGIYNVALPLATSLGIFLTAFAPIFYPIIASMIAKGQEKNVHQVYATMIRWTYLFSAPLLLLIILFPKLIINIFFGEQYLAASTVLVILSLSYFINITVGLTFETLVSFGKTKLIFWLNSLAVIVNILLAVLLTPRFGIIGAATGTAITIALREIISFIIVKRLINLRLCSLIKNYLKITLSLAVSLILTAIIYLLLREVLSLYFLMSVAILTLFGSYFLLLFISRAINYDDYLILDAIGQRIGFKVERFQRFFK